MVVRGSEGQGAMTVRIDRIVWSTLFVFVPLSIAFVGALPLHVVEIFVFLVAAGISVGLYWILQREGFEENRTIGVALGLSSIVVLAILVVVGHSLDVNVLGNYAPHFGNIAAWAFPTLMWFETKAYLTRREFADGRSEESIEAVGFGVALLYAVAYSLMDANFSEPIEYVVVLLLLVWIVWQFVRLLMKRA